MLYKRLVPLPATASIWTGNASRSKPIDQRYIDLWNIIICNTFIIIYYIYRL